MTVPVKKLARGEGWWVCGALMLRARMGVGGRGQPVSVFFRPSVVQWLLVGWLRRPAADRAVAELSSGRMALISAGGTSGIAVRVGWGARADGMRGAGVRLVRPVRQAGGGQQTPRGRGLLRLRAGKRNKPRPRRPYPSPRGCYRLVGHRLFRKAARKAEQAAPYQPVRRSPAAPSAPSCLGRATTWPSPDTKPTAAEPGPPGPVADAVCTRTPTNPHCDPGCVTGGN
jgi:hypothetical protein